MDELSFIRPLWLLLIVPVLGVFATLIGRRAGAGWARYIPHEKLVWITESGGRDQSTYWVILVATLLAIIAAAGPSWHSLPNAGLKNRQATVIAFDLSDSMLAWDLKPSRLERGRLKLIDLLRTRRDGETALIAYGGDAFQVSPLTDDSRTIEALIPTLHPDVMPTPGSNTESAVQLALQTLNDTGTERGDIILFTDGIAPDAQREIHNLIPPGVRLSILAIAKDQTVMVPDVNGQPIRDATGMPVLATIQMQALESLTNRFSGQFAQITDDQSDIARLAKLNRQAILSDDADQRTQFDAKSDGGWVLVLILLPIALMAFRRNVLWLLLIMLPIYEPVHAVGWDSLWSNPDQQAIHALRNDEPHRAAGLFTIPRWSVIANFRAGNYVQAAKTLPGNATASDHYNRANALAMLGRLPDALTAYDRALSTNPSFADARFNRELVKQTWQRIQHERKAAQQRRRRVRGDETERTKDQGDQQALAENSQQSNQVGGSSSDGDNQDQHAVKDQGSSTQRSAADDAKTPPKPQAKLNKLADSSAKSLAQGNTEKSSTLNPYSEQWLRNLQSDPGALMRRKFHYQATKRMAREKALGRSQPLNRARRY